MSIPPDAGVRVRRLSAHFGGRRALAPIDLDAEPGRTLCVVGPGGSGKSTLLSIIAGYAAPGIDIAGDVDVTGTVGSMPQRCPVIDTTLRDLLHAVDRDVDPVAMIERVWQDEGAIALVRALLDTNLHDHDAGGCRLAGLTHLVARRPDVLILDEPEAGQPNIVREWIVGLIRRETERSATVVLATHHLGLARAAADHVVFLVDGETIESGPADRFFTDPAHSRTRQFVELGS